MNHPPLPRTCLTAVLAVTLLCAGCDLRMTDPRWQALAKRGVAFVPGESGHATFLMGTTTDEGLGLGTL